MKSKAALWVCVLVACILASTGCQDMVDVNLPYGYIIEQDRVLWYDTPIEGADAESFEWLTDDGKELPWGRDKHRLYYRNRPIPESDPASFVGWWEKPRYAKDKNHVYVGSHRLAKRVVVSDTIARWRREMRIPSSGLRILEGADAKSFRYLRCDWFVDDYHLFRAGEMIEHVDVATFRPLDPEHDKWNDWHVDANHVYKGDILLKHADPKTFRIDEETRDPMDDQFVFFGHQRYEAVVHGEIVPADSSGWKTLTDFYRTDGTFVFAYGGRHVEDADPETFQIVNGRFCKDSRHVFYRDKLMPFVDAETLRIEENGVPVDAVGPVGDRLRK